MLKLGEKSISKLFLGDKAISKAYFGNKLVFSGKNYTEIEYIQSTGTQYIDTGIVYQNGYDIECRFGCNTSAAGSKFLFGVYGDGNNKQCAFSTYAGWNTTTARAYFYKGLVNQTVANNTINKVEVKNKTWYYNDTVYGDAWDFDSSNGLTMYLFAGHTTVASTNANYYFIGKIHSFKMWNGDVLVRDYIPVLDQNNVPCMYDKVSGEFFYNQGTGEFIAGGVL